MAQGTRIRIGSDRKLERVARTFMQGLGTLLRDSAPLWNAHVPRTTQNLCCSNRQYHNEPLEVIPSSTWVMSFDHDACITDKMVS